MTTPLGLSRARARARHISGAGSGAGPFTESGESRAAYACGPASRDGCSKLR